MTDFRLVVGAVAATCPVCHVAVPLPLLYEHARDEHSKRPWAEVNIVYQCPRCGACQDSEVAATGLFVCALCRWESGFTPQPLGKRLHPPGGIVSAAHISHPPISEFGLADGCPACEAKANDPVSSLDARNLNAHWRRMLDVEFRHEGPYRSHAEQQVCWKLLFVARFIQRCGGDPFLLEVEA